MLVKAIVLKHLKAHFHDLLRVLKVYEAILGLFRVLILSDLLYLSRYLLIQLILALSLVYWRLVGVSFRLFINHHMFCHLLWFGSLHLSLVGLICWYFLHDPGSSEVMVMHVSPFSEYKALPIRIWHTSSITLHSHVY